MAQKVSVLYMDQVSQVANGTSSWANIANAADGLPGSSASCTMIADLSPAASSSYFLINSIGPSFCRYSDSPYTPGSKKITKVEIGFYTSFTMNGGVQQTLSHALNINNAGYSVILSRVMVIGAADLAATLTWVDITTHSQAPAKWNDAYLKSIKTRIYMNSVNEANDKTDIYNILYVYDTYLRITWEPTGGALFWNNF